MEGARRSGPENLELPPLNAIKEMWTGGVSAPWNLLVSAFVGVRLARPWAHLGCWREGMHCQTGGSCRPP